MKLARIFLYLVFLFLSLGALNISAQKVSAVTRRAIVQQLINDRAITSDCVREAGGASKVVEIRSVHLNGDRKAEYIVEGNSGCAFGANSAYGWVYGKDGNSYKMLFDAGPQIGISLKRTKTNGYYDLKVSYMGNYSSNWKATSTTHKFNGARYQ